jgi:predicted component of viral defense system (DUF524 family)
VAAVASVEVAVACRDPKVRIGLTIATLPGEKNDSIALFDDRSSRDADRDVPPIQLLESHEYRYEWSVAGVDRKNLKTDPQEIFQPDTDDGRTGRLRPGLATGLLRVVLRNEEETLGELELEVRSRKLAYRSEYQWMLRDIADRMTELLMQRFASSSALFEQDSARDAVTLYQRFEFLRALLADESIDAAIREIRRRPHVSWEADDEVVQPGRALRGSAQLVRSLARPGARRPWPGGQVETIPTQIVQSRTEAIHDTTPNRFIKFALERWRQVVSDIQSILMTSKDGVASERGLRETGIVLDKLDEMLHYELFKEVGALGHFPGDNQVLHRREGYRDVFRAYVEFELAAKLSWKHREDAHRAGQRDVAQLYEYWTFIRLSSLIAELAGSTFDISPILDVTSGGMSVGLRSGKQTVVWGEIERHHRKLSLEFTYNKTFSLKSGSWTKPMRPDYSLCISPTGEEKAKFEPVYLHFDAKYRVETIRELFGGDQEGDSEEVEEYDIRRRGPKRADLYKMHTYRDAIQRSAGAYVIYPGDDFEGNTENHSEYRELLPGLGAFVLRPSATGEAAGSNALRKFLNDVIDHLAKRFSRHEHGRYWVEEIYERYEVSRRSIFPLGMPSDDTTVLLGFVKSLEHWEWIKRNMSYNVRTEGQSGGVALNADLLYSQLLLLYGPGLKQLALARIVSAPGLITREAMKATEYPNPSRDYLCVQIADLSHDESIQKIPSTLIEEFVATSTGTRGQPLGVNWREVRAKFAS